MPKKHFPNALDVRQFIESLFLCAAIFITFSTVTLAESSGEPPTDHSEKVGAVSSPSVRSAFSPFRENVSAPANPTIIAEPSDAPLNAFAGNPARALSEKIFNFLPPCELNYFGPPIQFSEHGGDGNFPIYDRFGTGPCPNPRVIPPVLSPLEIRSIGNPPTPFSWEVYFHLPANLTGFTRTINLSVLSDGVSTGSAQIVQSGACSFYLSLQFGAPFFSGIGGIEEIELRAAPNCPAHYLTTDVQWMNVSGDLLVVDPVPGSSTLTSGERSGNVLIMVNGNPSPVRLPITQFFTQKPVIVRPSDKKHYLNTGRGSAIPLGVRG